MKKTLIAFALLCGARAVHALDLNLPACRQEGLWMPVYGKCDASGRLTGSGGALAGNMLIRGTFTNGIPDGKHEFAFVSGQEALADMRLFATSEVTTWSDFSRRAISREKELRSHLKEGWAHKVLENLNFCSVTFVAGAVDAQAVACTSPLGFRGAGGALSFRFLPVAAKAYIKSTRDTALGDWHNFAMGFGQHRGLRDPVVMEMDGPTIQVEGSGTYAGRAEGVLISASHVLVKGFEGTISNMVDTSFSGNRQSGSLQGYFDIACNWSHCRYREVALEQAATAVDERYLVRRTYFGKQYAYVPLKGGANATTGQRYVLYFKAPDGSEFDGSVALAACGASNPPRAKLVERDEQQGRSRVLDVIPECGRVTMPDGRSYTGRFDSNGRPVGN